ncbi:tetratricopeptide repeat protein [Actinoplanes sp. GCM10030250]|uniref:tetratricopeptide repeat protein n=1 Tax=Actinoplanes sp. GCM10030250 TaxID=3273376 RepID=UPI00360CE7D4
MAETPGAARRGRREATMDAALPEHRVALASRLRDLRDESGRPSYRRLSELAHCSFASLSAAAAGRRFPTWETTRGYVTGCLRHAGREADIDLVLGQWRRLWEDIDVREKAHRLDRPAAQVSAPPAPAVPVRKRSRWPIAAVVAVLVLMATMAAGDARRSAPQAMTGLFNILVVPFEGFPSSAGGLEHTLARELEQWARGETAVQTRGPDDVGRVAARGARARQDALTRLAADHNADVVLTGLLRPDGDTWTVVIEVVLTERVFAETPEFVGRHEFALTEPADVIRGNVEINQQLAGDAVRYVQAVVAFVRGLGRYALDDYPGAEREFRTADGGLAEPARRITGHTEVVLLMLGNAVGRTGRYAEAAAIFRRALARSPEYPRATIGLAEALRAGVTCGKGGVAPLRQALELYGRALPASGGGLVEMKTRLGLGLAYQCLSMSGTPRWTQADVQLADVQFAGVLRVHRGWASSGEARRQSLRLAAEARAGQALTAWRSGDLAGAAVAYEEAVSMLHAIGVVRPTIQERERIFLRNLRDTYVAMNESSQAEAVDARLLRAGGGS